MVTKIVIHKKMAFDFLILSKATHVVNYLPSAMSGSM